MNDFLLFDLSEVNKKGHKQMRSHFIPSFIYLYYTTIFSYHKWIKIVASHPIPFIDFVNPLPTYLIHALAPRLLIDSKNSK